MSKTKRLTDLAGLFMLGSALVYVWRPETYRLFIAGNIVFVGAMVYAAVRSTSVDRERGRRTAWMIPLSMLLVAAYVLFASSAEDQFRRAVIAAGLVAVGVVLYWARRRAT